MEFCLGNQKEKMKQKSAKNNSTFSILPPLKNPANPNEPKLSPYVNAYTLAKISRINNLKNICGHGNM